MNLTNLPFELTALTGTNRPIRLRLTTAKGVIDDLLLVKHISGVETICGGIEYSLLCVSNRAGMPLKQFIANPVELQFVTDTGGLRAVSGIVSGAVEGHGDGGLATYQLIVRDAFSLLEKTCNTRVFRNLSEVDITSVVLSEWRQANPVAARAFDFDVGHLKSYPAREFTMQYNESNAAFLRRLWKRRGLAWFVQPGRATEKGSDQTCLHTLVLFDDAMSLKENSAGVVRFHRDDGTEQRDTITSWHAVRTLTAGNVTRRSLDYARSWSMGSQTVGHNDQGKLGNQFASSLDDYLVDVPHAGADASDYDRLGVLRMQRLEYESKFFQAESGVRSLACAEWNLVKGHPELDSHPAHEREFVITELRVEAENNLPKTLDDRVRRLFALNHWSSDKLEQASAERGMRYTNRFTCVRRGIPIVPSYDPRIDLPRTETQSVTVVGPVSEEIHCDQFGRVKVRFPACRPTDHEHAHGAGASDSDRDSAWLRVSSAWAGAQFGAISLPRVGDEVIVVFLGGDPDKPLIIGRVHGAKTPPPSFSRTSVLPGDKHLSGIVSQEGKARRRNQLRMDDTPGQISAQLESEHGHSQLNLGYLTHPRRDGKAEPRGEGAELRSDQAVSIRGGNGVFISADASVRAAGRQLERDGLNGLAEALTGIQKQLAELADTHNAGRTDGEPLAQLAGHLKQWEEGSNIDGEKPDAVGGKPIVAIEAPAGLLLGSQSNVSIGAQTHVDVLSVGNTQISVGRKLMLHAMQSISLFAHKLGVKLIAASGKVEIQAHEDNVEITSAKRIILIASEEIVFQAPKVTVVTQGAQAVYGEGAISHKCTGGYAVNSTDVSFTGPTDSEPPRMRMPKEVPAHEQRVRIVDLNTGEPMPKQRFQATMEDGQVIEGTTDEMGLTQILESSIPFGQFTIKAIFE
ncbi:MAG: type VI secretion system Vgr family protein [Pseudomonadota bacterium]